MKQLICIAALALMFLLSGCTGQHDPLPEPVTMTPEWTTDTGQEPSEPPGDLQIRIHLDNTQSTHGFAGKDDNIIRMLTELTDWARFPGNISTWILEPIKGTKTLEWHQREPQFLQSALFRDEWELYTINDEDFPDNSGGPISTLFSQTADPNTLMVLVTDMLEQQSCLDPLTRYVEDLFQSDSHQQVRVYVADSAFDGKASYPVIIGERFAIRSSMFEGRRPFAVIAAGPAEAMDQLHQTMARCGVEFTEFMAENRRQPAETGLTVSASPVMQQNIFITDPADARCSLDVEPLQALEGCFAYRYHKYSAQKDPISRVSVLVEVDAGCQLTPGDITWWAWQQDLPAATEPVTEATETTEPPVWAWIPCAPPADAVLEIRRLEPGSALSDRSADESGVADITIPTGKWVYEVSILMAGDSFADKAYALELEMKTPLPANPLAKTENFQKWSTTFAAYSSLLQINEILADADSAPDEAKAAQSLKSALLSRIPDLELLLRALAAMDTGATETRAATVRIILQNY